jgi:fatty acid desaturase
LNVQQADGFERTMPESDTNWKLHLAVLVAAVMVFVVAGLTAGWGWALVILLLGVLVDPFLVLGSLVGLCFHSFVSWGRKDLKRAEKEVEAFHREHPDVKRKEPRREASQDASDTFPG